MTRSLLAFLVLALATGCGGGTPTSATPPTTLAAARADVAVALTPATLRESACTAPCPGDARFVVEYTVNVTERAGLGGNVNQIVSTLRNPLTGGELATSSLGANDIVALATSNHVNAHGSLAVRTRIFYRQNVRQLALTVALQFTDDRGNPIPKTAQATVEPLS